MLKLLNGQSGITADSTYDLNFNTVEYLKYDGKAIVVNGVPVKASDVISETVSYWLEIFATPKALFI